MSNEKPVRITVGDVKEVAEATTIQADTPIAKPASAVSYTASVPDTSGSGMMIGAGLVGVVLFILGGYFGLTKGVTPDAMKGGKAKAAAMSAPAGENNAPAATNAPVSNNNAPAPDANAANAPAPSAAPDTNAANAPAANNAPAPDANAANVPAANNAPK